MPVIWSKTSSTCEKSCGWYECRVGLSDGLVLQFANLRNGGYSGPVSTPGQVPMYPYQDQFGQVAWSHIPPSDVDIKRQPFYHEPMRVEEAKPPLPPSPPPGVIRTLSFAQRQVSRSRSCHASAAKFLAMRLCAGGKAMCWHLLAERYDKSMWRGE